MMECKSGAALLPSFRELTSTNNVVVGQDDSPSDGSTDISPSQVHNNSFFYCSITFLFISAIKLLWMMPTIPLITKT